MKKILIVILVFFIVFLIYLLNVDKKVYYLALGNSSKFSISSYGNEVKGYSFYVKEYLRKKNVLEKYVYEYANNDSRISDIINDIEKNKKVKSFMLKNSLVKADLVTISISLSDIYDKLIIDNIIYNDVYNYIDDLVLDLEKLFKILRTYCKERIIFIGFYNPFLYKEDSNINDIYDYLNKRFKSVCINYDIKFIDMSDISSLYLPNKESMFLNSEGYKKISLKVIKALRVDF